MVDKITLLDVADAEDALAGNPSKVAAWLVASTPIGDCNAPRSTHINTFDADALTTAQLLAVAFAGDSSNAVIGAALYTLRARFLSDHADERTRWAYHIAGVREAEAIADELF